MRCDIDHAQPGQAAERIQLGLALHKKVKRDIGSVVKSKSICNTPKFLLERKGKTTRNLCFVPLKHSEEAFRRAEESEEKRERRVQLDRKSDLR